MKWILQIFFSQGFRYVYEELESKGWGPQKIIKNRQKNQFCYLEKGVLELHRAATIKPRKIEGSGFSTGPRRKFKKSQKA